MGEERAVEQFRESCRASFTSVLARHGFSEEPLPKTRYTNEYQVRWASETTRVIVEGINWGLNIDVRLASVEDSVMEYKTYALDDLLAIRNPDFEREDGQSAQMAQFATQLAEHAPDVLSGDHRIFPKLAAAIRKRAKKFSKRW